MGTTVVGGVSRTAPVLHTCNRVRKPYIVVLHERASASCTGQTQSVSHSPRCLFEQVSWDVNYNDYGLVDTGLRLEGQGAACRPLLKSRPRARGDRGSSVSRHRGFGALRGPQEIRQKGVISQVSVNS